MVKDKVAKYQYIATEIRKRINDNIYPPKTMVPDQQSLAVEFGVSRMTVKKSLDMLAKEGLIYKRSGLGTFVLGSVPLKFGDESPVTDFDGLTKMLGKRATTLVISFDVILPTEVLMKRLGVDEDEPVYDIKRLRYKDGKPFILEHTFMSARLVPGVTQTILKGSLYHYVHKILSQKLGGAYRKIHADKANTLDCEYLGAKSDDPILEVEQIVWLTNGTTLEYSKSRNLYTEREYSLTEINDV